MKIEQIYSKDEREGAGITRYGKSSYNAIGFNIVAETKDDQEFLKEFFVLYEDSNEYIETEIKKPIKNIKIWTSKCW